MKKEVISNTIKNFNRNSIILVAKGKNQPKEKKLTTKLFDTFQPKKYFMSDKLLFYQSRERKKYWEKYD